MESLKNIFEKIFSDMENAGNAKLSGNTDTELTTYNFDPHYTENFLNNTAVIILP